MCLDGEKNPVTLSFVVAFFAVKCLVFGKFANLVLAEIPSKTKREMCLETNTW
jgi:hypothetical protein